MPIRQLGPSISTLSTNQVVEACHEEVPDAAPEEIMEALNVVGQQYKREADALRITAFDRPRARS